MSAGVGIPILCYHSIDGSGSLVSVSPSLFLEHMTYLAERRYCVLSLGEAVRRYDRGERFGFTTVILTFDDGYRNNHEVALPILNRLGFGATFFVATRFVGQTAEWMERDLTEMFPSCRNPTSGAGLLRDCDRSQVARRIPYLLSLESDELSSQIHALLAASRLPMMTWDQLRDVAAAGMEIGDHAGAHRFMTEMTQDELFNDLRHSRHDLESRLGISIRSFCFPYGAYNEAVTQAIQAGGYMNACTTESGAALLDPVYRHTLPRILISGHHSRHRFAAMLTLLGRLLLRSKPLLRRWFRTGASERGSIPHGAMEYQRR